MQRESVTTILPAGDDRLTTGSGPVRVIMKDGVLLDKTAVINPDPEGVVSPWEQLRHKTRKQRERENNPIHRQPTRPREGRPAEYGPALLPSQLGCETAANGLHHWMRNGVHPVSKKQRWVCRHCERSTTEGK